LYAVGIDDWAWRKGCQYGTVICDLERRRIVALLPDRASGTSAAWLRDHPSIEFIARDRGASYGDAASKGAPQALHIADRWHLFENASASFLDVVRQNMHAIRKSSATDQIDPRITQLCRTQAVGEFPTPQEDGRRGVATDRTGNPT